MSGGLAAVLAAVAAGQHRFPAVCVVSGPGRRVAPGRKRRLLPAAGLARTARGHDARAARRHQRHGGTREILTRPQRPGPGHQEAGPRIIPGLPSLVAASFLRPRPCDHGSADGRHVSPSSATCLQLPWSSGTRWSSSNRSLVAVACGTAGCRTGGVSQSGGSPVGGLCTFPGHDAVTSQRVASEKTCARCVSPARQGRGVMWPGSPRSAC